MTIQESVTELLQIIADSDPQTQAAVIDFISCAARLDEPFTQEMRAAYDRHDRAALKAAIEKWTAALPC